ncbi:MAG: chemotaxis protein CheW, partial [Elusimicrobia bacterium]|nr:chemotaxis protein CheW [Elusimicrobiota bacterium]
TGGGHRVPSGGAQGGWVLLEITDDGAGIDPARLRERAIQKGLHSAEGRPPVGGPGRWLSFFVPGFSTAEKVTEVSGPRHRIGRGQKTTFEKVGGAIEILSAPGGNNVSNSDSLTLSIVPTLIVSDSQTDFAIPQTHVIELVRLGGERAAHVEWMEDAAVFRLRGRLLPLVFLRQALPPRTAPFRLDRPYPGGVAGRGPPFGLVVHRAKDTEEIVEKPLGRHFRASFYRGRLHSGGRTGRPDPGCDGARGVRHVIRPWNAPTAWPRPPRPRPGRKTGVLLLVAGVDDSRAAIPLDQVDRVEEISTAAIERVGGGR